MGRLSLYTRFWMKVKKTPSCWLWQGATRNGGYGVIYSGDKSIGVLAAHRYSYELHNGPIPGGLFILHRCDNPPCVNPSHLFCGSQIENMRDKWLKGRGILPETGGSKNGRSKLTESLVLKIRDLYKQGIRQCELVKRFNIGHRTISYIVRGKQWNL